MRVVAVVSLVATSLVGCSGITSVPYQEPAQSEHTARVRIITNSTVYGDSLPGNCAPANRHKMAQAGRFSEEGTASINYPQFPLAPASLGMPNRVSPKLLQYLGATRMAEGLYTELVTEYRVRTDVPFLIEMPEVSIGSYGSTYSSCSGKALAYTLTPGKDYEVLAGIGSGRNKEGAEVIMCMLGVSELVTLPNTKIAFPKQVMPAQAPQTVCAK